MCSIYMHVARDEIVSSKIGEDKRMPKILTDQKMSGCTESKQEKPKENSNKH